MTIVSLSFFFFFFQAEDGIRDLTVTGVQTCALPIWNLLGCAVFRGRRAHKFHDSNAGRPASALHRFRASGKEAGYQGALQLNPEVSPRSVSLGLYSGTSFESAPSSAARFRSRTLSKIFCSEASRTCALHFGPIT